jgi:putative PIN family toxin of toxin-antitoxin system
MRAVFDTNVVVSALVFGGRLAWIRDGWASGALVPVICRQTIQELLRVLACPKFRLSDGDQAILLEDYLPFAAIVVLPNPLPPLPVTCRDRSDSIFISLAMAASVPLVTGDADLVVLRPDLNIEVISAGELRSR